MKLVNLQSQQYEEVPDDQVQGAIASGRYGTDTPDAPLAVQTPDGQVGTVPMSQASQAFAAGAKGVSAADFQKAKLDAQYGGVGGTLAAGAEGLARGATVGLSDPLAIGAAGLFAGEAAAQQVREHLESEREAHPWVSTGTELLGAAAPLLATGGSSAVAEGAEAAEGASRMGALLRAIGAPTRAVSAAGQGAARLAAPLIDGIPGAAGAVGRIAQAAARAGVTGSVEGALYGAGNEIDESWLGDHELTAEKVAAAMGHGALFGAMVGGGAGAGLETASQLGGAVLNRVAPGLERQAGDQAWRALGAQKGFAKEADRVGGASAVGKTLLDEGVIPSSPLEAAAMDGRQIADRVDKAIETKWQQMRPLLDNGGEVSADEVAKAVDDVIDQHKGLAGREDIASHLENYKQALFEKLGLVDEGLPAAAATQAERRTGAEIGEYLRQNPEGAAEYARTNKLPDSVIFKSPPMVGTGGARKGAVQLDSLMAQRKGLDDLLRGQSTMAPPVELAAMRQVRSNLADLELKAVQGADAETGAGPKLKALRTDYERLMVAKQAVDDAAANKAARHVASLGGTLMASAHLAGAIASGHPLGAAAAIGTALVHKMIRERGSQVAAATLSRIAKLDLLARASTKVDDAIDSSLARFLEKGSKAGRVIPRMVGASKDTDAPHERLAAAQEAVPAVARAALSPAHVDRAIPGLQAHAPNTAAALAATVNRGSQYLAAQAPKLPGSPGPLGPGPKQVDPMAASKAVREIHAVHDPLGTLDAALESGQVHMDEVKAIAASKPKLYAQFQRQAIVRVQEHAAAGHPVSFDQKITLSKLTQTPLDPLLTSKGVAWQQSIYAQAAAGAQAAGGAPKPKATKRKIGGEGSLSKDVGLSPGELA